MKNPLSSLRSTTLFEYISAHRWKILFTLTTAVFLSLAYKNPYSVKSLIPNLEPYPDTLYYAYPAWNFSKAGDYSMSYLGVNLQNRFPPLYSIYLIPWFKVFNDIRSYYFANMTLAILSIGTILLTIRQLLSHSKHQFTITSLTLLFWVTNFYIYTLPSLLMAENLTTFLISLSAYALVKSDDIVKTVLSSILGVCIWATKFVAAPIGAIFYFTASLRARQSGKTEFNKFLLLASINIAIFIIYLRFSGLLSGHINLNPETGFSLNHFSTSLKFYINALSGKSTSYLWHHWPMYSKVVLILFLVGLLTSINKIKTSIIHVYAIVGLTGQLLFISLFFHRDIRFFMPLYPLILILIASGLSQIGRRLKNKVFASAIAIIITAYFVIPLAGQFSTDSNLISFKKQVGLNFRHAEQPWNYLALMEINQFLAGKEKDSTYVATFLPLFYSNIFLNNYKLLPISNIQDFSHVYSDVFKNNIDDTYRQLLTQGSEIYITNAYINNIDFWSDNFEEKLTEFNAKLVYEGCKGTCNIYKLSL